MKRKPVTRCFALLIIAVLLTAASCCALAEEYGDELEIECTMGITDRNSGASLDVDTVLTHQVISAIGEDGMEKTFGSSCRIRRSIP